MSRHPFNDGWSYRTPLGPFAMAEALSTVPTPVTLPHDAMRDLARTPDASMKGANAYWPSAAFTYLRTLDAPPEWAGRLVSLEFDGAYRNAMVYVNDELAGHWADGYGRFVVRIDPYLRIGAANEIRVEVRAHADSRWYSGAGLHRGVQLIVTGPVHIGEVRVSTLELADDLAVVECATTVVNESPTTAHVRLGTTIEGQVQDVPVTVPPHDRVLVRGRFALPDPRPWSVEDPALYLCDVVLSGAEGVLEDVSTSYGVRRVQVDPVHGLRINGEPVLLRGACIHHDNGPLGAAAIPRAEERRIELLKAAGFNAIRAAHNPLSPAMLEACDRVGMLVMNEAWDMWTRAKTDHDHAHEFTDWWERDLESLVTSSYNHPSVIMYSIGNEIVEVGTPFGAVWARRLAEKLRSLDPTRLVTNGVNSALAVLDEITEQMRSGGINEMMAADPGDAMNQIAMSDTVTERTHESNSVLDVVGLNYAEGRYQLDGELFPERVIVGSETFPSKIATYWPLVTAFPHVIGDFTWTGWDYLGEVGIGATAYAEDESAVAALEREYPWLTAWCGDLDITGHRRPVSYYREIVFGLRDRPYLAVLRPERHGQTVTMQSPWAWSDSVASWTWPGCEGRPVTVEVYADADEVALLRDGVELGRAPVGESRGCLAVFETTYEPGTLTAVAFRDGAETGSCELTTAQGEVSLSLRVDRGRITDSSDDLAYIAVELVDSDGVLWTSVDRDVTVEVGGEGVLAGMCSANPCTTERFDQSTWQTFDGRALAVVRPTGAGEIEVRVSAEGCESATAHIRVDG